LISDEIYALIGSESFIMVNKKVLRLMKGNADAAVVLIELVNIHKMVSAKMNVDEFGYFRIPYNWIKKVLGMSPGKQKTILKFLEREDLLTSILKGYPSTRHISLNFFNIKTLLEMDETTEEDVRRQEFYDSLNNFLKSSSQREIIKHNRAFGNMKESLRGSIKYISIYTKNKYFVHFDWKSSDVGKLRDYINKRSFGKPYDYAFLKKVSDRIDKQPTCMGDFIDLVIKIGRETVENSPADQVFSVEEILNEN